jgi:hypothetical protein
MKCLVVIVRGLRSRRRYPRPSEADGHRKAESPAIAKESGSWSGRSDDPTISGEGKVHPTSAVPSAASFTS